MVQEQMVNPHHSDADLPTADQVPTADQELSSMDAEPEAAVTTETVEAVDEAEPDKHQTPDHNKPA